ncbi:hypothetical protein J4419_00405 [Candidatus Woesearchaeota archaeon]|nr:hypothetical protein [Candidatus Woesearchaeota archaeon]
MEEKKLVVDGIRFTYNGPFDIYEFHREIDRWMERKHFQKEIKKKQEQVEQDHKRLEYVFELWHKLSNYSIAVVRMKAFFDDVVDFEVERKGHKRMLQSGAVLVVFDGFIEENIDDWWGQKPWWAFLKSLIDKYIWHFWWNAHDDHVIEPCYDLYDTLYKFFRRH